MPSEIRDDSPEICESSEVAVVDCGAARRNKGSAPGRVREKREPMTFSESHRAYKKPRNEQTMKVLHLQGQRHRSEAPGPLDRAWIDKVEALEKQNQRLHAVINELQLHLPPGVAMAVFKSVMKREEAAEDDAALGQACIGYQRALERAQIKSKPKEPPRIRASSATPSEMQRRQHCDQVIPSPSNSRASPNALAKDQGVSIFPAPSGVTIEGKASLAEEERMKVVVEKIEEREHEEEEKELPTEFAPPKSPPQMLRNVVSITPQQPISVPQPRAQPTAQSQPTIQWALTAESSSGETQIVPVRVVPTPTLTVPQATTAGLLAAQQQALAQQQQQAAAASWLQQQGVTQAAAPHHTLSLQPVFQTH